MPARPRLLPLIASLLVLGTLSSSVSADTEPREFTLALGDAVFWSGPGSDEADCGANCWTYKLHVTESAFRLRVAIDRPRLGDLWSVELEDPAGSSLATFSPGSARYSAEGLEWGPPVGTFTVRVTASSVTDRRFRMRAMLERDNGGLANTHVLAPPDLQPLPPWDFSFMLPVTNGATGGTSTGVPLPGGRVACHAEEVVLYRAVRCLRMSYGVGNVGLGPLDLEVGPGMEFADGPLFQRVHYADGKGTITRSAGNAYYHHSHLHYHHDKAIGLELLKVVDPATGTLQPAGPPQRKGFAHRDELLRGWDFFAPIWNKQGFGLLPGWGDYYEWDRPGNYIDFGLNADGLYVIRMTADPDGFILETDRTDNVAYSLIQVTGDQVKHLQSGRGTDPWDPCRIPLPLGPEFENSFELPGPRPEECSDDSDFPQYL